MQQTDDISLSFLSRGKLRLTLQTEKAECGLACLCMIADYYGYATDISSLRKKYSTSMKGISLKNLVSIAGSMSFESRALRVDMNGLASVQLPCILHWNLNHFVVLKSISSSHAVIHDPAVGRRRLKIAEVARQFTGVALELNPASDFERKDERVKFTLRSLIGRVVGLKRSMLQLLGLGLVLQLFTLIAPFYLQWIIDDAIPASDKDLITILVIGFLALALIQSAVAGVRSWLAVSLSASLNFQWLGNVFSHMLKLPLAYFEKRGVGDIMSRFNAVSTMQRMLTTQFVEGAIDGILVITTFAMMVVYSRSLAAISGIAVIAYLLLRMIFFGPLRDVTAEHLIYLAKQQTQLLENVRGMQTIRLIGGSAIRKSSWKNALVEQFNAELKGSRYSVTYSASNTALFATERVLIIWLAALAVLKNEFSIGMLFAFLSYKDQFSQRTSSLIDKWFELRMMRVHGERLADLVFEQPEVENPTISRDLSAMSPDIEVRGLTFRYAGNERDVISALDLCIAAGECVAITGPSGCGKTTLVKLILGLLTPAQGTVYFGGERISAIGVEKFRTQIGAVLQDDTLFAGSISDNICFFDPNAEMADIEHACRLASIHQDILEMPMGYQTLAGEIGSGLSGGQMQRVLLARALYRRPQLLILDEATSHLDVANERVVNNAIAALNMTRIIVAHRPDTINMADRVVVLEAGRLNSDRRNDTRKGNS